MWKRRRQSPHSRTLYTWSLIQKFDFHFQYLSIIPYYLTIFNNFQLIKRLLSNDKGETW